MCVRAVREEDLKTGSYPGLDVFTRFGANLEGRVGSPESFEKLPDPARPVTFSEKFSIRPAGLWS